MPCHGGHKPLPCSQGGRRVTVTKALCCLPVGTNALIAIREMAWPAISVSIPTGNAKLDGEAGTLIIISNKSSTLLGVRESLVQ